MEIKFDKKNYRKHSEQNKKRIKKSLKECGAGRSVLVDADDTLIAGNGVFEQAQAMGIPTRVIETDGTELVVVKRTDLRTDDDKRKLLAMADNATSDNVEWDMETLQDDFEVEDLADWDIHLSEFTINDSKIKSKGELDIDSFDEEQELKLKFKPEQYSFVLSKLREYGDDFSASLLLILGYKHDDYE